MKLEILKYLHEKNYYWDECSIIDALAHGHLDCLKYLHTMGCPFPKEYFFTILNDQQFEAFKYLYQNEIYIKKSMDLKNLLNYANPVYHYRIKDIFEN